MKRDLKEEHRALYFPSAKAPVLVDVPAMPFLMVDGEGYPAEGGPFQGAIQTLYGLSYTLKFAAKKEGLDDWRVMPLEALWWTRPDGSLDMKDDRAAWHWTAMIAQAPWVTEARVRKAAVELRAKRNPPTLPRARFERFKEGRAAQVMHIGPYSEERPTIERLHAFIRQSGFEPRGKHHEIYLGDPRRTDPKRLKTVVRQPCG